jgi:ribosomal protein S8
MEPKLILVSATASCIFLAGCITAAFSQTELPESQFLMEAVNKRIAAMRVVDMAWKVPVTDQQIANALKQSRATVSVPFSKAAMKALAAIEHYDGQIESHHRIDAALEDVEIEASTKAENNEVTALKNTALNLETAIDIDINVLVAYKEIHSSIAALGGTPPPTNWTRELTREITTGAMTKENCFLSWKDALKTRKASLPSSCRIASGDYLFSDFAP